MAEHDTPVPTEQDTRPLPIQVDGDDVEWEPEPQNQSIYPLIESEADVAEKERADWWENYQPAARAKLALEVASIVLLGAFVLVVCFLLALACYSLVQIAP